MSYDYKKGKKRISDILINKLEPSDKVCIFYSEHADTLTFDLHKRLNESKATITFEKVEVGSKNALDFQLATFLGYEIASKKDDEYYIVSKDTGYTSVYNYWKKRKIGICLWQDKRTYNCSPKVHNSASSLG